MRVVIQARLRNEAMHRAADKVGNQSDLARHLGVCPSHISAWCNLKTCPPEIGNIPRKSKFTPKMLLKLETQLFDLIGMTLEEIFPQELRESQGRYAGWREQTRDLELAALEYQGRVEERGLLPSPVDVASDHELGDRLRGILEKLDRREREVIELRYGLDGGCSYDLAEVGKRLGVTRERIRQIEARALRKLQQPSRSVKVVSFLGCDTLEQELKARLDT